MSKSKDITEITQFYPGRAKSDHHSNTQCWKTEEVFQWLGDHAEQAAFLKAPGHGPNKGALGPD